MNIFALSDCPVEAARLQHDKHVVKMTLETAQLVSQAVRLRPDWYDLCDDRLDLYRITHRHHPSSRWCRATSGNLRWLCDHGIALADEYNYRFGPIHKSRQIIEIVYKLCLKLPDELMTKFAMAMPQEYKTDDPVLSYRLYYLAEKVKDDSNWTRRRRDLPDWMLHPALGV